MENRVKELRKKLHLRQYEFASKIGVSRVHLNYVENGKKPISKKVASAICQQFDVNPVWLEYGTGPMFIDKSPDDIIVALNKTPDTGIKSVLMNLISKLDDDDWIVLNRIYEKIKSQ